MTLIRIQECSEQAGIFQAKVSFNQGQEYDITVHDPFSKEEEESLEWYFEKHLSFPFTDQVKAQEAATSITTYGEKLFDQIFAADPLVLSTYKTVAQAELNTLLIEIVGQPSFHALHWEALKDPELSQPLALQATIVRRSTAPQGILATVRLSPTINLLIITARPRGMRDIGYRTISRPLIEALHQADVPVQVDILRPGTYKALENHLQEITRRHGVGYYHVIHFDVHGSLLTYEEFCIIIMSSSTRDQRSGRQIIRPYKGLKAFLALESEQEGTADLVTSEELAALLMEHQIPIAILNACQSGKQIGERETSLASYLMQSGIQMVLAMSYSVTVTAAELLMQALYQQLFDGRELSTALRAARAALYSHKKRRAYFDQKIDLEDWLLPVVYQNQPVMLRSRAFTPAEEATWFERQAEERRYIPPTPEYGFVGRDIDILQIEKLLLTQRNILLIRGMGGAGKTTLLKHLRAWWHMTGFVQQTFYFGYDEKAWTLQQILVEIARQLYGTKYYTDIQPYPQDEQQLMITERLRAEPHLLILDNLESITGAQLASQHTLPKSEQDVLRSFLAHLAKGKTRVLLGSRGGEGWQAKGTFDDNTYNLPGLDDEATSMLAERILERNGATKYREDEDLRHLLKLLDGFPLALEVVLPNLTHQTPKDVLTALQAGDVTLDTEDQEDKTKSILRCIDYSHSNLSPEAQQLLLCLAPFTSVIYLPGLKNYVQHLQKQPPLTSLPFERWLEVIQEAQNWGLLSPDPNIPDFLRLQPVLSYFLRNRLNISEQEHARKTVEAAFHEHYRGISTRLYLSLGSNDPLERIGAQVFTSLEYENLMTALNLALAEQDSILNPWRAISRYHSISSADTNNLRRAVELGQTTLSRLESYPAQKLIKELGFEWIGLINDIAGWQLALNEYAAVEEWYHKALNSIPTLKNIRKPLREKMQAVIYNQLGSLSREQRQWTQAETYYQKALQLFIKFKHPNQADVYRNLGDVVREQWQWTQAEAYYQKALQLFIKFNDRYEQARIYLALGGIAKDQVQLTQAKAYYLQALSLFSEFNDRYAQAGIYSNLAYIAQDLGQWAQAESYFQRALPLFIEIDATYDQVRIYLGLASVTRGQRQWTQAEAYNQRALQLSNELGDLHSQALAYSGLGTLAQKLEQWALAESYYQQALQLFIEHNDPLRQAGIYNNLGRLAQEQQRFAQACDYLLRALEIGESYSDHNLLSFV